MATNDDAASYQGQWRGWKIIVWFPPVYSAMAVA